MSQSSQSEKKSDTNISDLTEQVVFKGGIFKRNLLNVTGTLKSLTQQEESVFHVKSQNTDNLSFRTTDEKGHSNHNNIDQLCNKVSSLLKNHQIKDSPAPELELSEKNKESEIKKLFVKKTEKELEVFESERFDLNGNNDSSVDSQESFQNITNSNNNKNNNAPSEKESKDSNSNRKYLNKVICTLSKNESGFATFVSKDDLIFVLPSLFIPSNLNVGNTYVFKLAEVDQAQNKIDKVNSIHNYYSHEQI